MMNWFDLDSYRYISAERKSKPIEKASADREGVVISGLPVSKVLTSSSRQHFSKAVPADWTAAQIFSRCMCSSFNRTFRKRTYSSFIFSSAWELEKNKIKNALFSFKQYWKFNICYLMIQFYLSIYRWMI